MSGDENVDQADGHAALERLDQEVEVLMAERCRLVSILAATRPHLVAVEAALDERRAAYRSLHRRVDALEALPVGREL